MDCTELVSLIKSNSGTIAFIVGNGIHRYDNCISGLKKKSWDDLLLSLMRIFEVTRLDEKPKEGVSNPEFFDLIELLYIDGQVAKEKITFHKTITGLIKSCESIQSVNNMDILSIPHVSSNIQHYDELLSTKAITKANEYIDKRVNDIFNDFGIPKKEKSTAFDEQVFANDLLYGGARKFYIVKKIIKQLFENYPLGEWIRPFLRFAISSNSPIMTTNYDETLSSALNLPLRCMNSDSLTQYKFPVETYFSNNEICCPYKSFAVWHINGLIRYPQSIRIGYLDYADMFHEIQNRLFEDNTYLKIVNNENINNTWISIFFHRDILIMGLSLDIEEYVIRWLLVERARYNIMNKKKLKGWYVARYEEESTMPEGKKLFFNQVGFEIIYARSQDIYENVWKELINNN